MDFTANAQDTPNCTYLTGSFQVGVVDVTDGVAQSFNIPFSSTGFTAISMCYGDELWIEDVGSGLCTHGWYIRKENSFSTVPVLNAQSFPVATNYLYASGSQQTPLQAGVWYERWNNELHITQPLNPVHDNFFLSDLEPGIYWLAISHAPWYPNTNQTALPTYIRVHIRAPMLPLTASACKNETVNLNVQGCGLTTLIVICGMQVWFGLQDKQALQLHLMEIVPSVVL